MSEIACESAKEELTKSKEILERSVGYEITAIAYPDGSYNESVKDISEEIDDARIMNRHGISSTTTYESNILFLNKAFKNKAIKTKYV